MSELEREPNQEFNAVKQRFIRFVENHSDETTSDLMGAVRNGYYKIDVPNQLVPVNMVNIEVFDSDPDDYPGVNLGYAIELREGETDRFAIIFSHGEFNETTGESGFSSTEFTYARSLLDELEQLETAGKLTRVTD